MRLCAAAVVICFVLLAAGCGGGGSAGSNSTTPPGGGGGGGGANGEGANAATPKKATSPNAPAGSKVVACKVGAVEMEQLRATAVDCGSARETMRRWGRSRACTPGEASRSSCALDGFRCQAVKSDEGAAVSCARPGGDVSFVAKAWMVKRSGG